MGLPGPESFVRVGVFLYTVYLADARIGGFPRVPRLLRPAPPLVPGALPFGLLALFAKLWGMAAALQSAATDLPDKIFWSKFQIVRPHAL